MTDEDFPLARARMEADLAEGLAAMPKRLPGTYIWDAAGSAIFDRICRTEDYYLTRRESALIERAAPEIAALLGPGGSLVEYGSGASRKVRLLLDALEAPAAYVAIDISARYLADATGQLVRDYPGLSVTPIVADYGRPIVLDPAPAAPVLGFFPGSTIGNFDPAGAAALMGRMRETLGGGRLLIGHDPNRDPDLLARAYGDADGLMPALHLNLLAHLDRVLGAGLDPEAFRHEARIEDHPPRVEAHLVATRPVTVSIGRRRFGIEAGESIRTDTSYKMAEEDFLAIARQAGWTGERVWRDPDGLFLLHMLRPS